MHLGRETPELSIRSESVYDYVEETEEMVYESCEFNEGLAPISTKRMNGPTDYPVRKSLNRDTPEIFLTDSRDFDE